MRAPAPTLSLRSACVPLGLLLIASCGGRDGASPPPPGAAEPAGPAAPKTPLTAREAWRLEVPGESVVARRIVPHARGALVAWSVSGEVAFPDGTTVRARGEDTVVTRLSAEGAIESLHQLTGDGDEEVVELVAGDPAALVLRGDEPVTIAGVKLSPPPAPDEYTFPRWSALVSLDASGAPVAVQPLDASADGWRALYLGGDWIIASNHDREDEDHAVVQRLRGGKPVWSRELAGVSVGRLVELDGTIAAFTRARALGITRLDPDSGEVRSAGEIERMGSTWSGDLGELVGVAPAGDATVIYGHSGRESVQVKGETLSHSIEPLTVTLAKNGPPRRAQLLDVTGNVEAVGTVAGAPAALVDVIHNGALYGGRDVEHRGTYLVLGHGPEARLLPLVQYRYPNDDWENHPAEMVKGSARMVSLDAIIAGERVWRAGFCEQPRRGCLEQHQIEPAAPPGD